MAVIFDTIVNRRLVLVFNLHVVWQNELRRSRFDGVEVLAIRVVIPTNRLLNRRVEGRILTLVMLEASTHRLACLAVDLEVVDVPVVAKVTTSIVVLGLLIGVGRAATIVSVTLRLHS